MAKTKLLGEDKKRQLKEQQKIAKKKNKKKRGGPVKFFKEVGAELKKVTWPTGKDLMKTTVSVIVFIAIFAVIVYGIDTGLGALFRLIIT